MPAFNFQSRFAEAVENGEKNQTIRSRKKGNVGDTAYLYTGQRTKQCRKLGQSTLINARFVIIEEKCINDNEQHISAPSRLNDFAQADGFDCFVDMKRWFENQYGLPYSGWLYVWSVPLNKEGL